MIRSRFPSVSFAVTSSALVMMGVASPALATFIVPDGTNLGWTRGVTPNSAFAQWDRFTSTTGPNAPDIGSSATGTLAADAPNWNVFDRNRFSFITGGGNIYSFGGVVAPQVDVPNFGLGDSFTTTVLLQTRILGIEIDPASMRIGGVAPVEVRELFRQALGGFGGTLVDTLWRFELPGNAAGYVIQFEAASSSMSLDRVAVDTFAIPTPGAAALLSLVGLLAFRRRRA